ncbi:MAG: alcohol dehydrogenase catalytic domain-containing protein [Planctomycetota bacterium]
MQAMIIEAFGGPHVLKRSEMSVPEAIPGHGVVRMAASSVTPVDTKIRSGILPAMAPPFPAVLHGDVAGTIEAVGEGVERLKPGGEVLACAGGVKGSAGALAEYMLADLDLVSPKPTSRTLTCWQGGLYSRDAGYCKTVFYSP